MNNLSEKLQDFINLWIGDDNRIMSAIQNQEVCVYQDDENVWLEEINTDKRIGVHVDDDYQRYHLKERNFMYELKNRGVLGTDSNLFYLTTFGKYPVGAK